jgi:hypothetical protein
MLQTAFQISDADIQIVMTQMLGLPCDDEQAEIMLGQLNLDQASKSALMATDMGLQTTYAHQDLRDQIVASGFADSVVASWVRTDLSDDFTGATADQQQEWRCRWIDSHPFELIPTEDTLLAP